MRSTSAESVAQDRTRPAADETRPGPSGPVQPPAERPGGSQDAGSHDARPADRARAEQVRRIREQIRAGSYVPPLDEVAERLAAFFVVDRALLRRDAAQLRDRDEG
ncbi:MAG: flagellar biosynthesis anti-sigma factor FlgM [Actinobacteria bacterium]|nr:flagellar biosynthesis anti-sigma factor FlgM [Actinomycetota bacterium]